MEIGLILTLVLSACESLPFDIPWLTQDLPTATLAAGNERFETPTPESTDIPDVTPGPVTSLTIWVPPEMDPELDTEASQSFADRLRQFSDQNDGLQINVRVKAVSGIGGLLDSLTATRAAAPEALPDLIALSRPDLETAALKGLIFPIEGFTQIPDDNDWFNFAQDMALLQGGTFGLPFAGDALALIYRTETFQEVPNSWAELMGTETALAFPTESDQALFPLVLYLTVGGAIQDNQRRPMLEVDPLTEVFRFFQGGVESGVFPNWLSQYQTTGQVWTAFRDEQVNMAVTWVSNFLKEAPYDAALMPLLPIADITVSLGTGMSWAVATPEAHRQPLAVQLAEHLVEPNFLAEWTYAAGYIPPRPSSLKLWEDQVLTAKISQIALMTQLRPSNDIMTSLGPILREGTRKILLEMVDPAQAAQVAVESLGEQ